jgi:Asp/Glu/hydantoin racemase
LEQLIHVTLHTGPSTAPPSINNDEDIKASTDAILGDIDQGKLILDQYDGVLIACYSVHTLVHEIRARLAPIAEAQGSPKHVTGIFEASVLTAQLLIGPPSDEKWGIVTTGKFWEEHLTQGVKGCLGQARHEHNANFGGVFTTGLTAGDFHTVPPEEVEKRLTKATKLLLESGKVTCVVMGCAGMAGLESIIRSAAAELNGGKEVRDLHVVDGVKAGVMQLDQSIRSRQIFGPSHN